MNVETLAPPKKFDDEVAVSVPTVALPIVASDAVSDWNIDVRKLANDANSPPVVVVPMNVDDAAVIPLVTLSAVAVALVSEVAPVTVRFVVVAPLLTNEVA